MFRLCIDIYNSMTFRSILGWMDEADGQFPRTQRGKWGGRRCHRLCWSSQSGASAQCDGVEMNNFMKGRFVDNERVSGEVRFIVSTLRPSGRGSNFSGETEPKNRKLSQWRETRLCSRSSSTCRFMQRPAAVKSFRGSEHVLPRPLHPPPPSPATCTERASPRDQRPIKWIKSPWRNSQRPD